jgi:hypothetical protein
MVQVVILSDAKNLQPAWSAAVPGVSDQRERTQEARQRRIRPDGQSQTERPPCVGEAVLQFQS